jgi:hypothetical protein
MPGLDLTETSIFERAGLLGRAAHAHLQRRGVAGEPGRDCAEGRHLDTRAGELTLGHAQCLGLDVPEHGARRAVRVQCREFVTWRAGALAVLVDHLRRLLVAGSSTDRQ